MQRIFSVKQYVLPNKNFDEGIKLENTLVQMCNLGFKFWMDSIGPAVTFQIYDFVDNKREKESGRRKDLESISKESFNSKNEIQSDL